MAKEPSLDEILKKSGVSENTKRKLRDARSALMNEGAETAEPSPSRGHGAAAPDTTPVPSL